MIPILKTKRLTLNAFSQNDAKRVQQIAGSKYISDMTIAIPHPYPDGVAENWISQHMTFYLNRISITWAIRKNGILLIGAISLILNEKNKRAEIGYWLAKEYWNKGYCSEATKAVIKYSFKKLKLQKVNANHFSNNPASGRVMQKCGMIKEGCRRKLVIKNGKSLDLIDYGITKQEYNAL